MSILMVLFSQKVAPRWQECFRTLHPTHYRWRKHMHPTPPPPRLKNTSMDVVQGGGSVKSGWTNKGSDLGFQLNIPPPTHPPTTDPPPPSNFESFFGRFESILSRFLAATCNRLRIDSKTTEKRVEIDSRGGGMSREGGGGLSGTPLL